MQFWSDFKPLIFILTILFGLIYTALRLEELFKIVRNFLNGEN